MYPMQQAKLQDIQLLPRNNRKYNTTLIVYLQLVKFSNVPLQNIVNQFIPIYRCSGKMADDNL